MFFRFDLDNNITKYRFHFLNFAVRSSPFYVGHFRQHHVLRNDRIITRDDPLYYGQKHTSVALPGIVVPREYFSYIEDEYANVRSSNRKTNPYLPTTRFEEIDPVRELLFRQNRRGQPNVRPQRARFEEDPVPHVIGYFSISNKGIVPSDQRNGKVTK